MKIFWFIPTHGDSRYLGTSKGARQVDHAYMKQIAVAVDNLGYEGVLIPTGRSCEDPWITAASLIDATKNLKFLVALRPGVTTPALAARMASTFDRLSNGRVLLNLVTGGDEQELKGDGLYEDHSTRYKTAAEYVKIWRDLRKCRKTQFCRLATCCFRLHVVIPSKFSTGCDTVLSILLG